MYEECFSEGTRHMSVFGALMIGRLPELAQPTIRAQVISLPERQVLAKKAQVLAKKSRSQHLQILQDLLAIDPELRTAEEYRWRPIRKWCKDH
jgi:hypothetical protein